MSRARTFGVLGVSTAAALAILFGAGHALGFRLNFTDSAPLGLWRVHPFAAVERGELVEVCPPSLPIVRVMADRGYLGPGDCTAGVVSLLKPIAAVPGDTVTVRAGQPLQVNGKVLPWTEPMATLPGWPEGSYVVAEGNVWLLSTYSKGSFDSRYFGPVPVANVRGQAAPVMVKGDTKNMTKGFNHDWH